MKSYLFLITLLFSGSLHADPEAWIQQQADQQAVRELVEQENQHSREFMASEQALSKQLIAEMKQRLQSQSNQTEWQEKGYRYRRTYHGRYPHVERRSAANHQWEMVIDGSQQAKNHAYYQLNTPMISPDNRYALIAEDIVGNEVYRLSVRDLQTQTTTALDGVYSNGEAVWAQDSRTFYYLKKDPADLNVVGLVRHTLAEAPTQTQETLIYREADPQAYLSLSLSSSKQYLILTVNGINQSEARLLDLNEPGARLLMFLERKAQHEYYLDHSENGFYIRSNRQRPNFELFYAESAQAVWKPHYQPEMEKTFDSFVILKDYEIFNVRHAGIAHLYYRVKNTPQSLAQIPFPDANYTVSIQHGEGMDGEILSMNYSAFTTPKSQVQFNLRTQKWLTPFAAEADDYQSEYHTVTAQDSTQIPLTVIYKKSLFKHGKNPLLLTAYGAYGFSMQSVYGTAYRSLLDRGFVYAVAHVRGGGELGQHWHEQGRALNKKNSIQDFIDTAAWLQQAGYADTNRTYALAESAGGLLVAAAINQAPHLFRAAVLQVPFLDMLTVLADPHSAVASEIEEWGDIRRLSDYRYIQSYSPHDNIRPQAYPSILVMAAAQDSRTPFWESLKYITKLRRYNTGQNPILLTVENHGGHAGGYGRFNRIMRSASAYAFILKVDRTFGQTSSNNQTNTGIALP
ncbi:hypothetical protein A1D23_07425 [Chelonobacter oris]|uniref:prolyl oligopeptidase family serine peptidase n=1 Tax=Chelonobacter oris TaxID=505317 RepID=UPI00244AFFE9|nr:prolyl oligopeptidase family serine peptidase [Chelonobacter oris]MDH2999920.1 hypothetical protein [Chelonobacter oris]